jgi:hypothetical protein
LLLARAALWALALICGACAELRPVAPVAPVAPGTQASPAALTEFNRLIAIATQDPAFAGHYLESSVLFLGFTSEPEARVARLTQRPDVRAFQARFSLAELNAAFSSAADAFAKPRYGLLAISVSRRDNAVEVTTAYPLGVPSPDPERCSDLPQLPATAPGTSVPLVDRRDCRR